MKKITKQQKDFLRIDLGCGERCYHDPVTGEKFTGVDFRKASGVDIVHDLTVMPLPFKDNSVKEVYSSHFLEHLNGSQRTALLNDLYRVMVPGAKAVFQIPFYRNGRYYQDPTHAWPPITEGSPLYYNKAWRNANMIDHYLGITCDFESTTAVIFNPSQQAMLGTKNEETKMFFINHMWNVADDMVITFVKNAPK